MNAFDIQHSLGLDNAYDAGSASHFKPVVILTSDGVAFLAPGQPAAFSSSSIGHLSLRFASAYRRSSLQLHQKEQYASQEKEYTRAYARADLVPRGSVAIH